MKNTDENEVANNECNYNNMCIYDTALEKELNLESTRSNANTDAYRDMDGFDVDEELARLHKALDVAEGCAPEVYPTLFEFIEVAVRNIDESLRRMGTLPRAWSGATKRYTGDASVANSKDPE